MKAGSGYVLLAGALVCAAGLAAGGADSPFAAKALDTAPATMRRARPKPALPPLPELAHLPGVKLHQVIARTEEEEEAEVEQQTLFSLDTGIFLSRLEAQGTLQEILQYAAPVPRACVIYETAVPKGCYRIEISGGGGRAGLFKKVAETYDKVFHLQVSPATREIPVLVLKADPQKVKSLTKISSFSGRGSSTSYTGASIRYTGDTDLADFAESILARHLGMTVIDETALKGEYHLSVSISGTSGKERKDSATESLQSEGLLLTEEKRPMPVVVVTRSPSVPATTQARTQPGIPQRSLPP